MKKTFSLVSAAACMAALTAAAFPVTAASAEKIYGTMNIPYADFYAAEIDGAYEVDAVSSATRARDENSKAKWQMNQEGGLVAGTYRRYSRA